MAVPLPEGDEMSQLRESRRKTGPKYFLEVPLSSLRTEDGRVDKCRTEYFPHNETQFTTSVKYVPRPKRSSDRMKLAIALTGIIGGLYGLWLLWESMQ